MYSDFVFSYIFERRPKSHLFGDHLAEEELVDFPIHYMHILAFICVR